MSRETFDLASSVFDRPGVSARPLPRQSRPSTRTGAVSRDLSKDREALFQEEGEEEDEDNLNKDFEMSKVRVKFTAVEGNNNKTEKKKGQQNHAKQHTKEPYSAKKKHSVRGQERKAARQLEKDLLTAADNPDPAVLQELLRTMQMPRKVVGSQAYSSSAKLEFTNFKRIYEDRQAEAQRREELKKAKENAVSETEKAIASIAAPPAPHTDTSPADEPAALDNVVDSATEEQQLPLFPILPPGVNPDDLYLPEALVQEAIKDYQAQEEAKAKRKAEKKAAKIAKKEKKRLKKLKKKQKKEKEAKDAEDNQNQGNGNETPGNRDNSETQGADGGGGGVSSKDTGGGQAGGSGGTGGSSGGGGKDDPPRRPPAGGRNIANKETGEDEDDESDEIDPAAGQPDPGPRTRLPKAKETTAEHQNWTWVILFIWDESNPRFEAHWIENLSPKFNIPLQTDDSGRTRKHEQRVAKGRGKKQQVIIIQVSLFLKLEETHSLKQARDVAMTLNDDFETILAEEGSVDTAYLKMVNKYSYKKYRDFDIRLRNGPPPKLDPHFPKNRAKPAPPVDSAVEAAQPAAAAQSFTEPPTVLAPHDVSAESSGASTKSSKKSRPTGPTRSSPRKYRGHTLEQIEAFIEDYEENFEPDDRVRAELAALRSAKETKLREMKDAQQRKRKVTASETTTKKSTAAHDGRGNVSVSKAQNVSRNIFHEETIPASQFSESNLDLGTQDQPPAIAGGSSSDPVEEQRKALAAPSTSTAAEDPREESDEVVHVPMDTSAGSNVSTASGTKGPRRSTLEFPGTMKAPKKNETEAKRHEEFCEIVGEGRDIQARMVDRLDKKIDVLAGEYYHLPHIRSELARVQSQITTVKDDQKALAERLLRFMQKFEDFTKQQEAPFNEKYDSCRELLSPWIPFESDDDIIGLFDQSNKKAFNQRMSCMSAVAWVWLNRDNHRVFVRSFYRKFFERSYLETKNWGQDRTDRSKLPQEIKDWILEYAVSIQDRLRWWEVSSEAFKGLLKTSITNKHYNDEHPDRGGQTSSSAAESTKGKSGKKSGTTKGKGKQKRPAQEPNPEDSPDDPTIKKSKAQTAALDVPTFHPRTMATPGSKTPPPEEFISSEEETEEDKAKRLEEEANPMYTPEESGEEEEEEEDE